MSSSPISKDDSQMEGSFHEILLPLEDDQPNNEPIQAYYLSIDPKKCSKLVKDLSARLPLQLAPNLCHLKRVRNPSLFHGAAESKNGNPPAPKKAKSSGQRLEVLLHCTTVVDSIELSEFRKELQSEYGEFGTALVPGGPPRSQEECQHFSRTLWPTAFFPLQSLEHKREQRRLTDQDLSTMKFGMTQVLQKSIPSAVVVDPKTNQIVSSSWSERDKQKPAIVNNPLATPVLLAIQGVSRLERQSTIDAIKAQVDDVDKKSGQYLCTGMDLYVTYEPTVFESMACLHARLNRIVFSTRDNPTIPVLLGGFSNHFIHCLPGTNHSFRAFRFQGAVSAAMNHT